MQEAGRNPLRPASCILQQMITSLSGQTRRQARSALQWAPRKQTLAAAAMNEPE
jgi:hypothetical protein